MKLRHNSVCLLWGGGKDALTECSPHTMSGSLPSDEVGKSYTHPVGYIVFDVDATRQAARQRALPCEATLPAAKRRLEAVCGPGYTGRKRGEVVRTRTTALHMHTRQWIGTYGGKGNGEYRGELAAALRAITTYLTHFDFPAEVALVRLDGQYGDAAVIAQLMLAGVYLVTRGRGYQLLVHPQIQRILAHPPTASVTASNTGVSVDLFEGGWLELGAGLPHARVIVARHPAPAADKKVRVGNVWGNGSMSSSSPQWMRIGSWSRMSWISIMGVEPSKWCLPMRMSKKMPTAGVPTRSVERRLWQIACQWVWNLRLTLGKMLQGDELREMEWAPPTETAPLFFAWQDPPEAYGPWQCAGESGRAAGRFTADAFTLQEDGKLRCPAGASLWLSEVRQENAFTQRAIYLAYQTDCQPCALREQCLASGAKGDRARRVSVVRRLLPHPATVSRKPTVLGPIRWVDVAGRALRRTWTAHWRRRYVEILPLVQTQQEVVPPPRPPRAIRSHSRWSWHDRLARNAWWGPPQLRVSVAGVPAFLATH